MGAVRWLGRAGAVAQVDTVTASGTWAQGEKVTLTINGKDLVCTIGTSVTNADVATLIKEAWEGDTLSDNTASYIPENGGQDFIEFAEATATVSSAVVTITHDTAGTPFTLAAADDSGTGTATAATVTAATGPNHYDNADNWDTGVLPAATDDVYIDNSDVDILYGLDASAVALTSFNIARSYTGNIGLEKLNPAGYVEYRESGGYLQIDTNALLIGYGEGSGSGRIMIDQGANISAVNIESTGTSGAIGLGAVIWKGTNAGNTLRMASGSLSLAPFNGESAALTSVTNGSGEITSGVKCSVTTITNGSGTYTGRSDMTTLTQGPAATTTILGAATLGTGNIDGGTLNWLSSGTITTLNLGGPTGATLDCSLDNTGRTITTATLSAGATIVDPMRTITYTNKIALGTDAEAISVT